MTKNVKLTIDETGPAVTGTARTPMQEMTKDANKVVTVTDGKGRSITLMKPGIVWYFRMMKMIGDYPQRYINLAYPMMFVTAIDGDPVGFPNSEAEIDAVISRLGDEGVSAVLVGVSENWGAKDETEAVKTKIKKSPPTTE